MKLPQIKKIAYKNHFPHYDMKYAIYFGGTSICFCDNEKRADLITKIMSDWTKSVKGVKWYKNLIKEYKKKYESTT